jgi:poly(A) polymerase
MAQDVLGGALTICEVLQHNGFEAYLVGGCVRDALLGIIPKDFDIATKAEPARIKALFREATKVTPSEAYGVVMVSIDNNRYEVATFRRDIGSADGRRPSSVEFAQVEQDAARRDFTINTLYLDPVSWQLIDNVGGLDDVNARVLRFVGDPKERITEDRLRVLRAVRFKNRFKLNYAPATWQALIDASTPEQMASLSHERVGIELTRILKHSTRAEAVEDLDRLGLLALYLPEVKACQGVEQPKIYHAEGDVYVHTLDVLKNLPAESSAVLVWAGLLHDIGKPATQAIDPTSGHITFKAHSEQGANLARTALTRCRLSGQDRASAVWLVENHMALMKIADTRVSKQIMLMRHSLFGDLLRLYLADSRASQHEPARQERQKQAEEYAQRLWQEFKHRPTPARERSLKDIGVDGHWVMARLGLTKGDARVGEILERLNIELLEGRIKTEEEATDWLKANR